MKADQIQRKVVFQRWHAFQSEILELREELGHVDMLVGGTRDDKALFSAEKAEIKPRDRGGQRFELKVLQWHVKQAPWVLDGQRVQVDEVLRKPRQRGHEGRSEIEGQEGGSPDEHAKPPVACGEQPDGAVAATDA